MIFNLRFVIPPKCTVHFFWLSFLKKVSPVGSVQALVMLTGIVFHRAYFIQDKLVPVFIVWITLDFTKL